MVQFWFTWDNYQDIQQCLNVCNLTEWQFLAEWYWSLHLCYKHTHTNENHETNPQQFKTTMHTYYFASINATQPPTYLAMKNQPVQHVHSITTLRHEGLFLSVNIIQLVAKCLNAFKTVCSQESTKCDSLQIYFHFARSIHEMLMPVFMYYLSNAKVTHYDKSTWYSIDFHTESITNATIQMTIFQSKSYFPE